MRGLSADLSERQLRDAARLAVQSAIAAAAMFSLMQALGLPEKFVGILSAVLVVQPTVGNTLGEAWQRFIATVVGCVIGVTCLWLLPSGYGTAVALAISMVVMHLVAALRPEWRYGVVAAVALALGSESEAFATALDRSIAIGVGVVVGALVTLVVWPNRASKRAERYLETALGAAARRLHKTVRAAQEGGDGEAEDERGTFHRNFQRAREAVEAVRLGDTERLERRRDAVERFYNSVLFLNRVAEERDEPLIEDDELGEGVDTIRHCGCEIAIALAGDESLSSSERDENLKKIRQALEEIRQAVTERRDDADTHILLAALVFGLDEVEDSLSELLELCADDDSG